MNLKIPELNLTSIEKLGWLPKLLTWEKLNASAEHRVSRAVGRTEVNEGGDHFSSASEDSRATPDPAHWPYNHTVSSS